MYGAILGDMIGAPYEFDQGDKTKNFELFDRRKWVRYTDDSAMTLAIAKAIMNVGPGACEKTMKAEFVRCMQDIGRFQEAVNIRARKIIKEYDKRMEETGDWTLAAEADKKICSMAKEQAVNTLNKVLKISSIDMKNGFNLQDN